MKPSILIIDDDADISILLQKFLNRKGYLTDVSFSAQEGLKKIGEKEYEVVFSDYRLGDKSGLHVLKEIKKIHPHTEVIIITAYSEIKLAVNMIKSGAFDYMSKPLVPEELLAVTKKALEHRASKGNEPSKSKANGKKKVPLSFEDSVFIGKSRAIKDVYKKVELVAPTEYNVILHGESGSGKEIIAHFIHQKSQRKSGPFVAVDCGTLSRELANSELFGHIKGSFTGAINDKRGYFESANGGTLFLDEIANLSYDVQAALLRVLQERKMKRVGGTKEIELNVRIIVASHEDLREAYKKKLFREDLFHRLNEFPIEIPSLRNRKEDISGFATFFLDLTNRETGKEIRGFDKEVMKIFKAYPWPGNIRELRNVIRKAALLTSTEEITKDSLSSDLFTHPMDITNPHNNFDVVTPQQGGETDLKSIAQEAEYQTIIKVLQSVNYNKSEAAKLLNIDRKTLYNKLKEYEK